jgi:hypothetical protein
MASRSPAGSPASKSIRCRFAPLFAPCGVGVAALDALILTTDGVPADAPKQVPVPAPVGRNPSLVFAREELLDPLDVVGSQIDTQNIAILGPHRYDIIRAHAVDDQKMIVMAT